MTLGCPDVSVVKSQEQEEKVEVEEEAEEAVEGINRSGCRCVFLSLYLQPSTKPVPLGTVLFLLHVFFKLILWHSG